MSVQLQKKYEIHAKGTNVMKDFIFGARSSVPANKKLSNGYTLYEWIMRMNCPPVFWARSLTGSNKLTAEEIDFLKSKNCKIALIYDNLTEEKVSTNFGEDEGLKAVEALKELGVPDTTDVTVFAAIDDSWTVNHNWMINFFITLLRNGYKTGFIGNTDSSVNFNFDRQFSHYVQAKCEAACWATAPSVTGEPETWAPYAPSEIETEDVALWQTESKKYKLIDYACVYGRDKSVLDLMWDGNTQEKEEE